MTKATDAHWRIPGSARHGTVEWERIARLGVGQQRKLRWPLQALDARLLSPGGGAVGHWDRNGELHG